jgi:ribosomal protein L6P/L9E
MIRRCIELRIEMPVNVRVRVERHDGTAIVDDWDFEFSHETVIKDVRAAVENAIEEAIEKGTFEEWR